MKRPNFFKADYDLVRYIRFIANGLKERNLESAVRDLEVNDAWKKFNGITREIIEENILTHKSYEERLKRCGLTTQEKKRSRRDLI